MASQDDILDSALDEAQMSETSEAKAGDAAASTDVAAAEFAAAAAAATTAAADGKIDKGVGLVQEMEKVDMGAKWSFEADLGYAVNELEDGRTASVRLPPGLVACKCQRAGCEKRETRDASGAVSGGGAGVAAFSKCGKCGSPYCSRECQVADWKGGHKRMCDQLKAVRAGTKIVKSAALLRALQKIRLYMCPFAVNKAAQCGPGFVFVQTSCQATELHYVLPVNSSGEVLSRSMVIAYMATDEFADLMKDDFEMGIARQPLLDAIAKNDPAKRLVVLVRARCGFVGVVDFPLVPDHGICVALGGDYKDHSMLQLNLDDDLQ
jgi:hypothetical protein